MHWTFSSASWTVIQPRGCRHVKPLPTRGLQGTWLKALCGRSILMSPPCYCGAVFSQV